MIRFKKDNGKEYPNWEEKELQQVADIFDGTHQTPKYVNDGIPFVSVENIKNLYKTNKYITEESFKKEFKTYPQNGDILMTRIGSIGVPTIVTKDIKMAYYVSLALIKLKEKVNTEYLLQYILCKKFQQELWKRTLHIAFPKKINKNEICKCKVNIPCLEEQQKIADFLSSVDDVIQIQEQEITVLEEQKKGIIQKLFNREVRFKADDGSEYPKWERKKVKDIFKITRGYVLAVNSTKIRREDDYQYPVYSSQTKDNGLMGYYNEYLYENAITWTTDGANAGTVAFRKGKFYCTNVCGVLISNNGNANVCMAEIINSISYKYVSYVGNPKLMNNVMAEIEIEVPCLEEQQKISDCLLAYDEAIQIKKDKLETWKEIKKGLLQQMFV